MTMLCVVFPRKSCPNFQDVDSNSLSVKDRIKAFEFFQNDQDVKLRDGSKPKRKKPTSKAFDDFESQGILIGFVSIFWSLLIQILS